MVKAKVEKEWNKDKIWEYIQASDRWMVHSLMAIYKRQTPREQSNATTIEDNGVGFNGVDAGFMTGMVEWYNKKGFFTDKQKAYIRTKLKKYCGQLEKIANHEI
jgi:hypothetical protein